MRIILAACFLVALAACSRQANENFRKGVHDSGVQACTRDMRARLVREARWTDDMAPEITNVCGCFVETQMENASTAELMARAARERTPDEQAERDRIMDRCREPFDRREMTVAQRNANPSQAELEAIERMRGTPAAAGGPPPAVRARPTVALATLATDDDYPAAALRDEAEGRVGFALEIGPDGRVTNCTITASSGSAALDSTTCRIMRSRALYEPARDARGAPAPDRDAGALSWALPAD